LPAPADRTEAHFVNLHGKPKPQESTEARRRARLWVLNEWLAVDEWLAVVESARYLDSEAAERGWIPLRRDPFRQIPPERSDAFYLAVGQLHASLIQRGIEPVLPRSRRSPMSAIRWLICGYTSPSSAA
jgi:hypothetical protein